ncbi:AraC family transcriptional regulator [Ferrimonas balearica]|uniref:AraC family transcriptional regulator n=1 Tax=Ferrimonas balearica TaxID=44012 RepID=UPI001C58843F|nr:AraC family transcriptional regulator [Ferrimonas balearica]MBW3163632.1 AraC family transcriptional regulator [Ferrimonas balearica]MBY6105822.1 AraC family transcriptional regulator [Ferrimonas balearica]MBY6223635.1 AraC family transcriptional regulator [Ferrimonas balearica]
MESDRVTLPNFYLHQVTELVGSYQVDTVSWLASLGLTPFEPDDEPTSLSWRTFQQLLHDARQLTGEPSFGLMVGKRLLVNTHGMLGYAAINSGTIVEAVQIFERFLPLRTDLVQFSHHWVDDALCIRITESRPLESIGRPVMEAAVMSLKNVLDYLSLNHKVVDHIRFPYEADEQSPLLRELIGCDIRYRQKWAGLVVPKAVAVRPLRVAKTGSFREAERICRAELKQLDDAQTFTNQIRRWLLQSQLGFPSLELTARRFNLTPRTLHRRLVAEGTSYQQQLDQVRHKLALQYLQQGQWSVQEVAFALGYSDTANFRRAFKRWQSVPPSHCRPRGER